MRKFSMTIAVCLAMAAALPFTDRLAVSEDSAAYTHYIYMIGHAGWLHWAVNAWTLLVMHNLFRWYRVAAAYGFAVLVSYVMLPERPMVGASVFTCFFIGFATPYLWRKSRLTVAMTMALLLLTCILPGFAGLQHAAAFVFGLAFSHAEGFCHELTRRIKE